MRVHAKVTVVLLPLFIGSAGLVGFLVPRSPATLRWAVRHDHLRLARWQLRHAKYTLGNGRTGSVLNDAIQTGDGDLLRELISAGADPNTADEGVTALYEAVASQRDGMVDVLLRAGADVNARCNRGQTALLSAASLGRTDHVGKLLAAGADVRAADATGSTPLMWAAQGGADVALVRLLVRRGADVNAVHPRDGDTALLYAARAAKPDVVAYLIDAGADPRWESLGGMAANALIAAAVQDRSDNLAVLVFKGVDVNRRNRDGLTALMAIATSWGRLNATRTLLWLGADPSLREPGGLTTAEMARRAREYDKADLLAAAAATRPAAVPVKPVPDVSHDHVPAD